MKNKKIVLIVLSVLLVIFSAFMGVGYYFSNKSNVVASADTGIQTTAVERAGTNSIYMSYKKGDEIQDALKPISNYTFTASDTLTFRMPSTIAEKCTIKIKNERTVSNPAIPLQFIFFSGSSSPYVGDLPIGTYEYTVNNGIESFQIKKQSTTGTVPYVNITEVTVQFNSGLTVYFINQDLYSTSGSGSYQEGYNAGLADGVQAGNQEGWNNGYYEGLEEGIKQGGQVSYDKGYDDGYQSGLGANLASVSGIDSVIGMLKNVYSIFTVKIFGFFSLGDIVGICLILGIVFFVLKLIRG